MFTTKSSRQSSEQVLCQILGWYLKKMNFKYDFVDAVPNLSTRWYTGTLDVHLLFECSELYISIFLYIYEVDILFRNSLGSNFNIWFESLKHIKTYV